MNQYRFEIPASIVVSVQAVTLAEAEKLAERIRADALEAAPDGYAVDLTDVVVPGAGEVPAVLWVNDDGSKPRCVNGPEDELRAAEGADDYEIPF